MNCATMARLSRLSLPPPNIPCRASARPRSSVAEPARCCAPASCSWTPRDCSLPEKGAATGVDGRLGYTRAALGRRPQQSDGIFELVVVQNHAQAQQRLYSLPAANTAKPGHGTHTGEKIRLCLVSKNGDIFPQKGPDCA